MARERTAKRRDENEVEFSRIVAFSDGVFSIAITLLVLSLAVEPGLSDGELGQALLDQRDALLSYAISFAVIARFWLNHHRFFSEVTAFDGRLIAMNMVYLAFIVLIPFSSQVLGDYGGQLPSVLLYSINLAAVVTLGFVMSADARRAGLTTIDAETHREALVRTAWIAGVFLASILIALANARVAQFFWLILFLDPTRRVVTRMREREGDDSG